MSIIDQQLPASKAMANGREIGVYEGENWISKNISPSQRRYSERESDLKSGYFGGFNVEIPSGRGRQNMYPDNRITFEGGDAVSSSRGIESIKDSRTAAQLG